jgi:hypothetical protein
MEWEGPIYFHIRVVVHTYCEFELKCVFSSFEYFQFEFNRIFIPRNHTVFYMKVGLGFRVLGF